MKSDIIGSQKGIQTVAILQFGMDGNPSQESLQRSASIFNELWIESSGGFLFGQGWNNGTGTFVMQFFKEPQEIAVSSQDGGKRLSLAQIVALGTHINTVRSVFVDTFGMLDGIGNLGRVKKEEGTKATEGTRRFSQLSFDRQNNADRDIRHGCMGRTVM